MHAHERKLQPNGLHRSLLNAAGGTGTGMYGSPPVDVGSPHAWVYLTGFYVLTSTLPLSSIKLWPHFTDQAQQD